MFIFVKANFGFIKIIKDTLNVHCFDLKPLLHARDS